VALLAGCAPASPTPDALNSRPDDFRILYEWQEGSLPPPYHYEYSIAIEPDGHGQIALIPDYPAPQVPTWTETFQVSQAGLDALYHVMVSQGLFARRDWHPQDDPPVGGSSQSMQVTAHQKTITIPSYVAPDQASAAEAMAAAVSAAVPQAIWDKLNAQREAYVREREQPATPTASITLSLPQLKYRLIEEFGGMGESSGIFYCDPDFYPVGRGDVDELALERFPEIQQDAEVLQAILEHHQLAGISNFSREQKALIYQDYKQLRALTLEPAGDSFAFQFNAADAQGGFFAIEGSIAPSGDITIARQEATPNFGCPICLAGATRIDTPQGPVAVAALREGMAVWTLDTSGTRVPTVIVKTVRVGVSAGHQVVHLRLEDGRELFASPGHPTADGRRLGELRPGDSLDGSRVISAERVPYAEPATYDLLPAGETGFYWAEGILVGSTLF
jgi:hypothetical protein